MICIGRMIPLFSQLSLDPMQLSLPETIRARSSSLSGFVFVCVLLAGFNLLVVLPTVVCGQETPSAKELFGDGFDNEELRVGTDPKVEPLTEQEVREARLLISNLSSSSFAQREQSAEELLQIGMGVVPAMRRELKMTSDPEVATRLRALIHQLHDGAFESRVKAFTEGQDVDFEGWNEFRLRFGDSLKSRDLFIKLVRRYPKTITSLSGSPRESAQSMELVQTQVSQSLRVAPPSVTDAVAMLLHAANHDVPVTEAYENTMLMVLRMNPVSRVPSDPVIGPPFKKLINAWVQRSTIGNRSTVFTLALQRDIYAAHPLAIKTIDNSTDEELIVMAMQILARFGSKNDTEKLLKFMDDTRTLNGFVFHNGVRIEVQLRDAAMATIAILHEIPLSKLGLPDAAVDRYYGFHYEDLIYQTEVAPPSDLDQPRKVKRPSVKEIELRTQKKRESAKQTLISLLPAKYKPKSK